MQFTIIARLSRFVKRFFKKFSPFFFFMQKYVKSRIISYLEKHLFRLPFGGRLSVNQALDYKILFVRTDISRGVGTQKYRAEGSCNNKPSPVGEGGIDEPMVRVNDG